MPFPTHKNYKTMSECCPICCDESKKLKVLNCCEQKVCDDCIYEHIKNVLQEGLTGDGRKTLVCPMGCGQDLTDKAIRKSIRKKNFNYRHHVLGVIILNIFKKMGLFFCLAWFGGDLYVHLSDRMTKSRNETMDLMLYERWSLSVALLNRSEEDRGEEDVIRCPAPNCEYLWFGSTQYRSRKRENEPNISTNGSITSMILSNASSLFYHPLPSETLPPSWTNCPTEKDGRKLTCPKCKSEFCGLCRRPWILPTRNHKRLCHKGKSCHTFSQKTIVEENGYALTEAKMCPGCSMLVHRTSGCNHMTCVCGFQWCYVCECRWHVGHYGCTDDSRIVDTFCAIS